MYRPGLSIAVVGLLSLAFVPRWVAAEDAPKKVQKVFVEVCVAEVSVAKLRALGFAWSADRMAFVPTYRNDDETVDLMSFIDALAKDDLARILSRPRLATMSGRTVSFQVGDNQGEGVRLDLIPQVLDTQKIQLQYRLELKLPKPDAAGEANRRHSVTRQLVLDSATELEPGQACCVSETRAHRTSDNGKVEEMATMVLVRADFKPPAEIRTAEKLPPRPVLDGRLREVELPKR